jgi:hypothetical protein
MEKQIINEQVNIGNEETVGYFKGTAADKIDRIIGKLNYDIYGLRY